MANSISTFKSFEKMIESNPTLSKTLNVNQMLTGENGGMIQEFYRLLSSFEEFLINGVETILVTKGVSRDSTLIETLDVKHNKGMFELLANDYYENISKGRKAGARKVPINDLVEWIKKKNISYKGSINSAAFAIQTSIYKNGIRGKNYEEIVVNFTADAISEFMSGFIQQTTTINMLKGFYQFTNNKYVSIGVQYEGINKSV